MPQIRRVLRDHNQIYVCFKESYQQLVPVGYLMVVCVLLSSQMTSERSLGIVRQIWDPNNCYLGIGDGEAWSIPWIWIVKVANLLYKSNMYQGILACLKGNRILTSLPTLSCSGLCHQENLVGSFDSRERLFASQIGCILVKSWLYIYRWKFYLCGIKDKVFIISGKMTLLLIKLSRYSVGVYHLFRQVIHIKN